MTNWSNQDLDTLVKALAYAMSYTYQNHEQLKTMTWLPQDSVTFLLESTGRDWERFRLLEERLQKEQAKRAAPIKEEPEVATSGKDSSH